VLAVLPSGVLTVMEKEFCQQAVRDSPRFAGAGFTDTTRGIGVPVVPTCRADDVKTRMAPFAVMALVAFANCSRKKV